MPLARCEVMADKPENVKLLKLNLIWIINYPTNKNVLKFGRLIIFKNLNNEFSLKEDSSVPIGWSLRFLR